MASATYSAVLSCAQSRLVQHAGAAWNGVAYSFAMQEQQTIACVAVGDGCQQRSRIALQDRGSENALQTIKHDFGFGHDVIGL